MPELQTKVWDQQRDGAGRHESYGALDVWRAGAVSGSADAALALKSRAHTFSHTRPGQAGYFPLVIRQIITLT